ncbi:MAG: hypothetical protein M0R00_04130 [Candidatus Omnitrophica bacterium]|jgi:hypothetical protein|nr:hypothetical protein [Candidatus Omnitrophota bacterium]
MRNEVRGILGKLQSIKEKVEGYLGNAEEAENDERIDALSAELDSLGTAIEALEEIE